MQSLATSAATVHDLAPSEDLLQGEEGCVWGDAGYRGIEKREAHQDGKVAWHVAMGPGQGRKLARDQLERLMEGCKSSVRARWDTCFLCEADVWHRQGGLRSLAKNENRLALLVDLPICCVPSLVGCESDGIGVSDKHQSEKHPTI